MTVKQENFKGYHKPINIGVSLFFGGAFTSFWGNGAGQNMYFLVKALQAVPGVKDVYFVYWELDADTIPDMVKTELDAMGIGLYLLKDVVANKDVIIEGTLGMTATHADMVHSHGHKVVSYRMGNDYIMENEMFAYGFGNPRGVSDAEYDALWVLPHHMGTNKWFYETMYGLEAQVVPYVWDSFFVERQAALVADDPANKGFGYFEPNMSLLKTCYTPILIAENVYRQRSELLEHMYVCNTYEKRDLPNFVSFTSHLEMAKHGVLSAESRYITPHFLGFYTDVVLSYNWQNGLNNIYYEVLHANYPFVHNSEFLRDAHVGFYYDGFDAYEGRDALIDAITTYDNHFESHVENNQAFVASANPLHPDVIAAHEELLYQLLVE